MLLTMTFEFDELGQKISYPMSDLGFVLMKHPDHVLKRKMSFGKSTVFYPRCDERSCTVALHIETDPLAFAGHHVKYKREHKMPLEPYVNDRPYSSTSLLAVALRENFSTAMSGKSKERPELADAVFSVRVELPCVAVRGRRELVNELFEPLGYEVKSKNISLDSLYPEWGDYPYKHLTLTGKRRVSDLLAHLYILCPVLDRQKHYFLDEAEVDKIMRYGEKWLVTHPRREYILRRFLKFRHLFKEAQKELDQLALWEETDVMSIADIPETETISENLPPANMTLQPHEERLQKVADILRTSGAKRVLDLGCGEGKLLRLLVKHAEFQQITGIDLNAKSLERAAKRLHLDKYSELSKRVKLLQGSLSYADSRLCGYDAATLVEVIEHIEPHRLETVAQNIFGIARPRLVVLTTPNYEYNALFKTHQENEQEEEQVIPQKIVSNHSDFSSIEHMTHRLRHKDHRFEWTRAELQEWAQNMAKKYGYKVSFDGVGDEHPVYGSLTQMALFHLDVDLSEIHVHTSKTKSGDVL